MNKLNKIRKLILFMIICIIIVISINPNRTLANQEDTNIFEFTESIEEFNNPDIGFYKPTGVRVAPEGNWYEGSIWNSGGLVHLRIGLRAFSEKYNKVQDYDITEDTIEKLNIWINQVRENGGTAIVRFAYDDFEGTPNLEPDIEQIEKHIEQLKPFFEANEDIISGVETGLLGSYGEQHTSKIVSDENIKRVTEKLLEVVPKSRTVSVRRPRYYACTVGIDINKIDEDVTEEGTNAYRIGVFNDGYLGSRSDLGTFVNREKEIAWLNNQATHTLYGGEAVWVESLKEYDENGYLFNSPEHIEEEMFQTHTSYLNEQWNYDLVNKWKDTSYTGKDELYNGKTTVFTYVKNHLGYRIVLKSAKLPKKIEQDTTKLISISLENVGAGNVVNEKDMFLILKNDTNEYSIPLSIDIRKWYSRQTQNLNIDFAVSKDMEPGNYEVYLKVVNKGEGAEAKKRTIRFANDNVWDEEVAGNLLGNIEIVKKKAIINSKISTDKSEYKPKDDVILSVKLDNIKNLDDKINVYNATIVYDKDVFEQLSKEDFETKNSWEELKYNPENEQFILIKKQGTNTDEEIVNIHLTPKESAEPCTTYLKLENIITSYGENDINIEKPDDVEIKIIENTDITPTPDATQTPSITPTPDTTETPNITPTPDTTETPNITPTTDTTQTPNVTPTPDTTHTPKITPTSDAKHTPNETIPITEETPKNNTIVKPNNQNNNKGDGIANTNLPYAGKSKSIIKIILIIAIISMIIAYIKMKKVSMKEKRYSKKLLLVIGVFIILQTMLLSTSVKADGLIGDINQDSKINIEDVNILENILIDINSEEDKNLADMNKDGTINVTDLSLLVNYIENHKEEQDVT